MFEDKFVFDLPGRGAILQLRGFVGEDLEARVVFYEVWHEFLGTIL
jgi:hypothetical protein